MPTIADKPKLTIRLPYQYEVRDYQLPFWDAMHSGYKRAILLRHRRSGKDKDAWNFMISEAVNEVGNYYYFFPKLKQGRRVIWDGKDKSGMPFMSHVPTELLARDPNNSEMKLVFKNLKNQKETGSIIQILGTDYFNDLMGAGPKGCVFSEYSLQNPQVWDYIRPMLLENEGWAVFIYTPRGKNHGYKLFNVATESKHWYVEKLTIEDTGVMTVDDIAREIEEGMDESLVKQEYWCSFEGSSQEAYYAKQMARAWEEERIKKIKIDPLVPVHTWWDLGINDMMSIWLTQTYGDTIKVIAHYGNSNYGLDHYINWLHDFRDKYEFTYAKKGHHAPHDIKVRELTTGVSRLETAKKMGINFDIVDNIPLKDGIDAVRMILPRCEFDAEKCKDGIDALENYRREWDAEKKVFKDQPRHDWSSHPSSSFRYLAVGHRMTELKQQLRYKQISGEAQTKYPKHRPLQRKSPKYSPYSRVGIS